MGKMMERKILEPCPFCGSENLNVNRIGSRPDYYVHCLSCHCNTGVCRDEAAARAAWNQRPTPTRTEAASE